MLWRNFRYTSLQQDEEKPDQQEVYTTNETSLLVRWCIITILVCSAVDICALAYRTFWSSSSLPINPISFEQLPLRSTYLRLDELYKEKHQQSTPHGPVINVPRAFAQVSSAEPNRMFTQWPIWWSSESGFVPFADLRVLVTPQVSTIAQFRVMDYGMENCSLTFRTPSPADQASQPATNVTISGFDTPDSAEIDVWLLATDEKVDLNKLSWANKPSRDRQIGTLSLSPGTIAALPGLSCRSGTYLVFELACTAPDCFVDVVVPIQELLGLYLRQYQTI